MTNKHDIDELFSCADGEMPEQLPLLSAEERNRIYKMSERKFNKDSGEISAEEGITVSGVERYSRPVWKRRLASVAAAGVLLAGSGGLAYYIKNGTLDGFNETAVDMMSPSTAADYQEIAAYLLDGYTDFRTKCDSPALDTTQSIRLQYGVDLEETYAIRVAENDINSIDDLRELGGKYMTGDYLDAAFDLKKAFELDVFDIHDAQNGVVAISDISNFLDEYNSKFFTFDGELYSGPLTSNEVTESSRSKWTYRDMTVSDETETSFKVKAVLVRSTGEPHDEFDEVFDFSRDSETGEWRISNDTVLKHTILDTDEPVYEAIVEACSSRFIHLQEYIFTRSTNPEDTVKFPLRTINGGTEEVTLYKVDYNITNSGNEYWNAHTIDEIKKLSHMENACFNECTGMLYVLDDDINEDNINGNYYEDMKMLCEYYGANMMQYRGDIYRAFDSQANGKYLGVLSDDYKIVSKSDTELIFRREIGMKATHAEINSIPQMYEFKVKKDYLGDWKLVSVQPVTDDPDEKLSSNESKTEVHINQADIENEPSKVYCESMIYSYNYTINALMSYDYIDSSRTIVYHTNISDKTEISAYFAPYSHPDKRTPEDIDNLLKELFTQDYLNNFASPYYSALRSTPIVDRDFGDYPDGYTWENPSSEELQNSPFVSMFIYRNGELYRNTNRTICWMPWYPLNARFTVSEPEKRGDSYIVIADCVGGNPSEIDSGIVTTKTRCEFRFEYEDDRWKIAEVGLLENN